MHEVGGFDRGHFSQKLNGPGLRYEVGLNIRNGRIVWVHGGVWCGEGNDLTLAREKYTDAVDCGELTIADRGYPDGNFFITPNTRPETAQAQKVIMSRHETVNKRLRQFNILQHVFRHDIAKHPNCFYAVATLTELMIEWGEELFQISLDAIDI